MNHHLTISCQQPQPTIHSQCSTTLQVQAEYHISTHYSLTLNVMIMEAIPGQTILKVNKDLRRYVHRHYYNY
jgi:hypothetical protein